MSELSKVIAEINNLIRALYSFIYIVSHEEARVEGAISELVNKLGMHMFSWSMSRGFLSGLDGKEVQAIKAKVENLKDPITMLDYIAEHPLGKNGEAEVYVLRDFHPFMDDPMVKRLLRDIAQKFKTEQRTVIFLSPSLNLPNELEKDITVIDWPLPDRKILSEILKEILQVAPEEMRRRKELEKLNDQLVEAALGLTANEAENIFAKTLVDAESPNPAAIILQEKKQIVRKSGFIEFVESSTTSDDIGGLTALKDWLGKRRRAFSDEARKFGIPQPKGMLLIGPPGCGKSLVAKTVGSMWVMPILRVDVGRLMGSLVGESESNLRAVLRVADSIAPCVMWIDEVEKGFAGTASSSQLDAGVTARVFGSFLTWMQEKKSSVFVVATANDVSALPPEFLRKGRFDEIFAIDLPSLKERAAILAVHFKKSGRNPKKFDCVKLASLAENFSGAELEQSINSGLHDAFDDNRELEQDDVVKTIGEITPLSETMEEKITALRKWMRGRARLANAPDEQNTLSNSRKRELDIRGEK